jgi:hypothetical protein
MILEEMERLLWLGVITAKGTNSSGNKSIFEVTILTSCPNRKSAFVVSMHHVAIPFLLYTIPTNIFLGNGFTTALFYNAIECNKIF